MNLPYKKAVLSIMLVLGFSAMPSSVVATSSDVQAAIAKMPKTRSELLAKFKECIDHFSDGGKVLARDILVKVEKSSQVTKQMVVMPFMKLLWNSKDKEVLASKLSLDKSIQASINKVQAVFDHMIAVLNQKEEQAPVEETASEAVVLEVQA